MAERLTALCAAATVVGGYAPMGSEISPLLAMEEARAVGRDRRLPRLRTIPPSRSASSPATRLRRARSGSCSPKLTAPAVEPDLILVPLIAVDGRGTRLGRGKGHYDRVLGRLRKRARGWSASAGRSSGSTTKSRATRGTCPLDGFASPERLEWFRR